MVVQAIALLDDLDKEINIYAMRVKVCFFKESVFDWKRFMTLLLKGMVRLAFPRNGQNHLRQYCICQSYPTHG
jgi:hypothetical protein